MSVGAVAAIDLGATSGRVMIGRVGADTLEVTAAARFANRPVRVRDGLYWDVLALYADALDGLRAAFRAAPDIRSVGIDSWAVDYALLRDGRMLGNPRHYRDDRNARGVTRAHEHIAPAELFARNGLQFLPFTTLYQLAAEPAEVLEVADRMLLIPDLVGFWLTGHAGVERTNASTTGLLDIRTGRWDTGLLARIGIDEAILPDLLAPGDTVGAIADPRSVGATAGVTVTAVGSHDTASAVAAVPLRPESAAYISCGTWGLVGVEVQEPVLTPEVAAARFTNEGGVDGRIRLLRNVMGLWILSEAVREWERAGGAVELPALLSAAAEISPERVPVFDVDDPRFLPPGDMPARIDQWCAEHAVAPPRTPAEYTRSIIESLAQAFADAAWRASALACVDLRAVHVVGGGARNALLCQRTADRAGLPVLAGPVEATAVGNVLVQARAGGLVSGSLESLRDLVARTHAPRRFDPR